MQLSGGDAVMPPGCPEVMRMDMTDGTRGSMERYAKRLRQGLRSLDIDTACMGFGAYRKEFKGKDGLLTLCVIAWVAFWGDGDEHEGPFLQVGTLVEPDDTWLACKVLELASGGSGTAGALVRLRDVVYERVAECHGIVDGECWALGPRAFRAAVVSVLDEQADGSQLGL